MSTPEFAPGQDPKCPFCKIAASTAFSPSENPQILYKDARITAFKNDADPVSSAAHIIIIINVHLPSIRSLNSDTIPLLLHMRNVAVMLLSHFVPSESAENPRSPEPNLAPQPTSSASVTQSPIVPPPTPSSPRDPPPLTLSHPHRIGFASPPSFPFARSSPTTPIIDLDNPSSRIPSIPLSTPHVHLHAFLLPMDRIGWTDVSRNWSFGPLGFYGIEDLIAEIRETESNCRVKTR